MVDPVTTAIAVAGRAISLAITGVRNAYKGWKEVRSFRNDYGVMWRDYDIFIRRMEELARRELGFLKKELDSNAETDLMTDAIVKQLTILAI